MLLYEHPLSSYAQKVKIALREKGIDFEARIPEGVGSGRSEGAFAETSPRQEVPSLIDGDDRLFDSTIILEYLEDRFPSPPLLPRVPMARARARMVEEVCDTVYEAVNWGLGELLWFRRAEGELAASLRAAAARQTAELQSWLAARLGSRAWFNGDAFGWADACVAPFLSRSRHYGLGPDEDSPVSAWLARVSDRPAVAVTFEEFEAAAADMSGAAERLASGAVRREYRDHRLEWMLKSDGLEIVLEGMQKRNIRFTWPL